ncbi:MAG TPA: 2-oxoglutarate dehydrogenase E1 component [Chitinophagales bacterium]|nr:2-oxoglutarate dehydrogenase E1 component [Chitinophagales bacterium]
MEKFSFISNADPGYIENLYEQFKKDSSSIDIEWRKFFEGFDFAVANSDGFSSKQNGNGEVITEPVKPSTPTSVESSDTVSKEFQVARLITAYRLKAHLISKTNPIRPRKDRHANLDLKFFGLSEEDLPKEFYAGELLLLGKTSLQNIVERLQKIYCRSIGVEYRYITEPEELKWFQEKFENGYSALNFSIEKKKRILEKLNDAVVFEKFLGTKYIGQKRFSLEGGETTIPALDAIINLASESGAEEIVFGMAHRGRLNVLANIMGKTYENIFNEFEGNINPDTTMGDGDVKYHLGYSSEVETTSGKKMNLKLSPNPSHLEAVDPVVGGFTRAKADTLYKGEYDSILPVIIHGDAAVAGQGVVYECLQMSLLNGYSTGGSLHFVINNQIGFTTDFDDARSSNYCTSYATTVLAPVLHVNGDDPEAVVFAVEFAVEYRQKFNKDIFVDMVCYRRYGHNEGDDPKFTQPKMYEAIAKHPNPREIYSKILTERGDVEAELAKEMEKSFWKELQDRLDFVKQNPLPYTYQQPELAWKKLRKSKPEDFDSSPDTFISEESIKLLAEKLTTIPESFDALPKIRQLLQKAKDHFEKENKIDWAWGEMLAYGSLLLEGHDVRLSGQDTIRGTFSHRHAVIYDESNNVGYNRLSNLTDTQGQFRIYNSLLSEFAVLGFEYGYSLANPETLTIWEAQFGDFSNGAQTIIDQFIIPGESKWNRMSGITLLLPHGYEGQGSEHSSARLERFLQMSADYNMAVVNITSPANFFHVLRRQLYRPFRKPLIVMSPKSLLRHPRCVSDWHELTRGGFKEVIDDALITDPLKVRKVLLCSGKIYYELLEKKEKEQKNDIAIVRLEQLYPLPEKQLQSLVSKYRTATFIWVQEEPYNMGAYSFLKMNWKPRDKEFYGLTRKASASPATGFAKMHAKEQEEIVGKALE